MDVPHRYDLEQISCVNKDVEKYNRRIRKRMNLSENTELIKIDLDRRGFTKHDQHMNAKGKELMAKRIAAAIQHTLKVCKKTPISTK
jgi:lysophospholipase L1-like esterase